MKTKLIILTAAAAALFYSCSADRDENVTPATEKTSAKEIKLNLESQKVEFEEVSIKTDTIIKLNSTGGNELPPEDGGDPKNLPPRK